MVRLSEIRRLRSLFTRSVGVRRHGKRKRPASVATVCESLEEKILLSVTTVLTDEISISGHTEHKPQSKTWQHDSTWWTVESSGGGTQIWRLDGTSWTNVLRVSSMRGHADAKVDGDLVHILIENESSSQLATIEYVSGTVGTYQPWSVQPNPVNVPLSSDTETATIDKDSTGRLWVAYDNGSQIQVRYSDGPYTSWSNPITLAGNVNSDDISVVTALPNGTIGVLWSNQNTDRFGFRYHVDGQNPNDWSADEIPAASSAQNIGSGMADDHLNVAVTSDGTLYAAVKTGYDTESSTTIGLLIRRPDGTWDPMYEVETHKTATRPIVQVSETQNKLLVFYRDKTDGRSVDYRESELSSISFGPSTTLFTDHQPNNPTGSKDPFTNEALVIASGEGFAFGATLSYGPASNTAPLVNAGSDGTIFLGQQAALSGFVSDDGLPAPPGNVTTGWTLASGPAGVSIGDPSALATLASFTQTGTYTFRLTADDGELSNVDEVTISVEPLPINQPPVVSAGSPQSLFLGESIAMTGSVSDDGLPINPGAATGLWTQNGGPGVASFSNPADPGTSVSFSDVGDYVLRLTADDGELTAFSEVVITVEAAPLTVTASFQDGVNGYSGTRDTRIRSDTPTRNYGSSSKLEIDGNPDFSTLIGWDLGSIAPGSQVVAASITVEVVKNSFDVFELWEVLHSWDERQATFVNAADGVAWDVAGAQGAGDRGTTVLGTITAPSLGPVTVELNQAGLELLERWIADPANNYGVIFQNYVNANTDDLDFRSSESSDGPRLTVEYALPGTPAGNQAPTINAGADQTIVWGDGAVLDGSVSDDGLPEDPGAVSVVWIQTDGSGVANFVNPADPTTAVSFTQSGNYTLRLTADDGELTAFDEVTVFVDPPPQNQPPTVTAAANATIVLGQQASLSGFVSDDGLPASPGSVTTTWTLESGPAGVAIDNPSALTASASFTQTGSYVFRVTADDGELSGFDEMTITVDPLPTNQPPAVSAGSPETLFLGESISLNGSVSDDGLPLNPGTVTSLWTQIGGPGVAGFADAAEPTTSVSLTQVGTYTLRLTADDGEFVASDDVSIEVVQPTESVEVSFQNGVSQGGTYAGMIDTVIKGRSPQTNYGQVDELEVDGRPDYGVLLKWNIGDIPAGSIVESVSITVNVTNRSGHTYELYTMLRDWQENEATWNEFASGATWGAAGAQGAGDHGADVLGVMTSSSKGPATFDLNAAGVAQVQSWVDNSGLNFGLIVSDYDNATNGLDFHSSEASNAANRPKLTIVYQAAPAPQQQSPASDAFAFSTTSSLAAPQELSGIWLSREEVLSLPTEGEAWEHLVAQAGQDTSSPNLSDQDEDTDVITLAKALVGVRLGDDALLEDVRKTVMNALDTEDGGRALALGRNLVSYVIAADLAGLEREDDARFRAWLEEVLTEQLEGRTLTEIHEERPNNWGTMAGASRAAIAAYLGDEAELQRTAEIFKGWLGDRSSYDGFKFQEDLSWHADPDNPVGINPKGAVKDGHSIDGALPDDMQRAGDDIPGDSFQWPPLETGYPWEALQGAFVQAEILYRAGYNVWEWEDRALLRAVEFLYDIGWEASGDDAWIPWIVDARYGTDLARGETASPGKNMGWTAWTHQNAGLLDTAYADYVAWADLI